MKTTMHGPSDGSRRFAACRFLLRYRFLIGLLLPVAVYGAWVVLSGCVQKWPAPADVQYPAPADGTQSPQSYTIVCYNVENLFDTEDDPLTSDEEFTPDGSYHWTKARLEDKWKKLYQVLAHIGGWSLPDIVGFAEVENREVLQGLLSHTPLAAAGYEIVHHDSPDSRGIDVALMYRRDRMQLIDERRIPVRFTQSPRKTTRDILYVKGLIAQDTLHVLVNHWPSKSGGEQKTEPMRADAARTVKGIVDSVLAAVPDAKIVVMGDFNDDPDSRSIREILKAGHPAAMPDRTLVNLTAYLHDRENGSYKYRNDWSYLDQMMVSDGLIHAASGLRTDTASMHVLRAAYLMEEDPSYLGEKPFRTYVGPRYHGGYSDHLPVYLTIEVK